MAETLLELGSLTVTAIAGGQYRGRCIEMLTAYEGAVIDRDQVEQLRDALDRWLEPDGPTRSTLKTALRYAARLVRDRDLEDVKRWEERLGPQHSSTPDRSRSGTRTDFADLFANVLEDVAAADAANDSPSSPTRNPYVLPAGSALELSSPATPASTEPEASRTSGANLLLEGLDVELVSQDGTTLIPRVPASHLVAQRDGGDPGICTCDTPVPSPMWGPARCYTCGGEVVNG